MVPSGPDPCIYSNSDDDVFFVIFDLLVVLRTRPGSFLTIRTNILSYVERTI